MNDYNFNSIKIIITIIIILMIIPYFIFDFFLLDILIVLNLILALSLFITAVWTEKIKNISFFPSLFIFSAFFNLLINISASLLILEKGAEFDDKLIKNYYSLIIDMESKSPVRNIIIFIILFLTGIIIIKGCTYISKKASLFEHKLFKDKLMAINEEYSSGMIKEIEAFIGKNEVSKENDFYCSLVETGKFLSIFEKIRIIIVAFNLIVVIFYSIINFIFKDKPIIESINIYIPLIIGNGILCMLPSIILSITMGIIVIKMTKSNF